MVAAIATRLSNDEVTSWLRRKRLDERAFLIRNYEILGALELVADEL